MTYKIDVSPPDHPHLSEEEYTAFDVEQAAQVFQTQAEPGEDWPLPKIVEDLATEERIEFLKPCGRTVVARLVTVGATA